MMNTLWFIFNFSNDFIIKYKPFCLNRNIEDLTREINQLNLEFDDIHLENEEMRDRLGIGSREELDVENIRRKRAVKEEQASALNRVLQKEVWF